MIQNAKITGTFLGIEDHGILTAMIYFDFGNGSSQGFGGYSFDYWNAELGARVGTAFAAEFIRSLLDAVGVDSWEKLIGCNVRVDSPGGAAGRITRIGHILRDHWLDTTSKNLRNSHA